MCMCVCVCVCVRERERERERENLENRSTDFIYSEMISSPLLSRRNN